MGCILTTGPHSRPQHRHPQLRAERREPDRQARPFLLKASYDVQQRRRQRDRKQTCGEQEGYEGRAPGWGRGGEGGGTCAGGLTSACVCENSPNSTVKKEGS